MTSKQVAKTEANANAVTVPDYIKQGTNRGNEGVTTDDLKLPRLDVLQALSPQVNKRKDSYIEGAEVGMIFNTLTEELYPEGVYVTPVHFTKRWLVWVNREKSQEGGLRGVFESAAAAESFVAARSDAEMLEIVPTAEHLALTDDGQEVIISMSKSKMKMSRKFNSLIRVNGGDRFSRRYFIFSVEENSTRGEFQNLDVSNAGFPAESIYRKAEELYNSVSAGENRGAAYGNDSEIPF